MSVSLRSFGGLSAEAFLGSFFDAVALRPERHPARGGLAVRDRFLYEVREIGGVDDGPTVLEYVRIGS
jgi:hypothetical protein